MFRSMRRKRQQLAHEEAVEILRAGTSGVLALAGDDGYPYAVPMSYVYADGKLYFHSARAGHKVDAVARSPKASFCVIAQDDVLPERFTTLFRSVIAFGTIRVLEDEAEKRAAIELLARRYSPNESAESVDAQIGSFLNALCLLELTIEHLTGKEAKELMMARS